MGLFSDGAMEERVAGDAGSHSREKVQAEIDELNHLAEIQEQVTADLSAKIEDPNFTRVKKLEMRLQRRTALIIAANFRKDADRLSLGLK